MVVGKTKVCLSKKPIIRIEELEYATEVQYDPKYKVHYIDVGMSSAGVQTLNKTVNSLPGSKFALVIENDVVCIFIIEREIELRSIRIGEDAQLKDLVMIHDVLKKVEF